MVTVWKRGPERPKRQEQPRAGVKTNTEGFNGEHDMRYLGLGQATLSDLPQHRPRSEFQPRNVAQLATGANLLRVARKSGRHPSTNVTLSPLRLPSYSGAHPQLPFPALVTP